MSEGLLLLGGNLGDRRRHLRAAIKSLRVLPKTRLLARSNVYETAPVGPSRRPYLNLIVRIQTGLTPIGLLVELKRIESLAGRRAGQRWGARTLDIDILRHGNARLKTDWLRIPHPRILERPFVLAPLNELAPSWKPDGRRSVASVLRRLNPGPGTVRIYRHGL